jgi:hypothetical protein
MMVSGGTHDMRSVDGKGDPNCIATHDGRRHLALPAHPRLAPIRAALIRLSIR